MSLTSLLVVATAAAKDSSIVQDAATAVVQNAAAVASNVAGKGGFTADVSLGQLVEFQLTGLLVVFTVLGGLTLMCVLMAWILKTVAPDQYHCKKKSPSPAPASKPAPAAVQTTAPVSIHPGLADEELIVILAAAATEAVGQPVAIVKFRTMDSMDWTWSVQGRVGQHTSHKL